MIRGVLSHCGGLLLLLTPDFMAWLVNNAKSPMCSSGLKITYIAQSFIFIQELKQGRNFSSQQIDVCVCVGLSFIFIPTPEAQAVILLSRHGKDSLAS